MYQKITFSPLITFLSFATPVLLTVTKAIFSPSRTLQGTFLTLILPFKPARVGSWWSIRHTRQTVVCWRSARDLRTRVLGRSLYTYLTLKKLGEQHLSLFSHTVSDSWLVPLDYSGLFSPRAPCTCGLRGWHQLKSYLVPSSPVWNGRRFNLKLGWALFAPWQDIICFSFLSSPVYI